MKYSVFLLICCSVFLLVINPAYSQNYEDSDQDNVPDNVDQCTGEPENYNNYQDEDGCPDEIPESAPNQIEDSDFDGIPDSVDACPLDAETMNNYEDEDGCPDEKPAVPVWIKNNAKWWAEDKISENDFLKGIEWMISNDIINLGPTPAVGSIKVTESDKEERQTESDPGVPDWIKKTASWWASGLITEKDFVAGLEYLVKEKIINVGIAADFSLSETTKISGKWTVLAGKGKELGQVDDPTGMYVDSSNNLYVIDQENSRLLKFVPGKSEWSKVPISRPLLYLWDVELSPGGDVFLLGKGVLERCYSPSGVCVELKSCYRDYLEGVGTIDYFCYMTAFVLDSKGNIFYTEHDYHDVNKYDFSTEKVINICQGAKHEGVNCINVRAIAIDASDNFYISTSGSRIYKFSTPTLKWSLIADAGKELGQVNNPHGLDIDPSGNLYVLDLGNGRVQKFIKDTAKWMETKYPETGLHSFNDCPENLAVDSSGVIYVSDFCGDKVLKFTPSK